MTRSQYDRRRARLHAILPAGVRLVPVSLTTSPPTVRVEPPSSAATAAITAFDWTDAAQAAWEDDQKPERKSLRSAAAKALADNAAYLALTPAQRAATPNQVAQTDALTRQVSALIRRLVQLD